MSEFELAPMGDRIIIELIEVDSETTAGIIIPDQAKDKPASGVVKAVGPGSLCTHCGKASPMPIEVGNVVLFGRYCGQEIKHNEKPYFILRYSEVFAVVS